MSVEKRLAEVLNNSVLVFAAEFYIQSVKE